MYTFIFAHLASTIINLMKMTDQFCLLFCVSLSNVFGLDTDDNTLNNFKRYFTDTLPALCAAKPCLFCVSQ